MIQKQSMLKLVALSMLVALGVVISPILRFEGMCPMAHFINIVCAVLLGPWYALLCATLIGVIRMVTMAIPPLALTGAVFGAFLSGICYRGSKGKILFAVLGEILGTGIVGAILSYPVMTFLWGKEGLSWLFYVPSFVCGTLIGGSIAYVFLRKLAASGMLCRLQTMLSSKSYQDAGGILANGVAIAAFGVICFLVIEVLTDILGLSGAGWSYLSFGLLGGCLLYAIYYWIRRRGKNDSQ